MDLTPTDFLSGLGGLANLPNPYREQQQVTQDQQQNQQGQNILATQALAISAAQQKQQQAQQYQTDVSDALKTGNFAGLYAKYPDQQKALQAAHDALDEPTKRAQERDLFAVSSYIKNGAVDSAKTLLQKRIEADKGAGQDASDDQQMLDALNSGDPQQVKSAADMALYAILPQDKRAAVFGKQGGGDNHVIGPGAALIDDIGKELYRNAARPIVKTIRNQDGTTSIVQVDADGTMTPIDDNATGGGGPASGGAASGTRYTGGWTPRSRNGGDNSDAAVDNKILGAARVLGVSPTADLSSMTPMQIAQAMTFGEGGEGTLADRNNNPANIRNADGSYRKFPTPQAGMAAAAALVARKLASGQTTVQSLIEGLPAGSASSPPGGAKVIYTSKGDGPGLVGGVTADGIDYAANWALEHGGQPPAGFARNKQSMAAMLNRTAELAKARGLSMQDIIHKGQDTKGGQVTVNEFDKGQAGKATRSLNVAVDHLIQLKAATNALQNGNTPLFNALSQGYERATGSALPTNATALRGIVADEVNKAVLGGAGALADREDVRDQLNVAGSPEQINGVINAYIGLMGGQLKGLERQYEAGTGRTDFGKYVSPHAARALGLESPQSSAPAVPADVLAILKKYGH